MNKTPSGRNMRVSMKQKKPQTYSGVGLLKNIPFEFTTFACTACKTEFLFGGKGPRNCRCKKRGGKYGAWKVTVNNFQFASLLEGERYTKLSYLNSSGVIRDLTLHPSFNLFGPAAVLVCRYVGDFEYKYEGKSIVEDTKGRVTPIFALKRKLFHANYPDYFLDVIYAER